GQMGDLVRVRDGFARNFLLPQGKALRATEANRKRFERDREYLEARNLERRSEAEAVAEKLNGQSFIVIRQAGETGQLYGSVSTRDIADLVDAGGFAITRTQVILNHPIKTIGVQSVDIALHPEVHATVSVNVARSADEAARQARGEDLTTIEDEYEFEVEEEETEGEEVAEEEAQA
ncbi:50S ribosomal protein L9, partial [Pseudoxanthobacter sp.]|uniref:50S ribosomal protein L9 n=1 Tax=Pseudoxanthobacter sp. TaxID=1925742 RepID=UPI002FDF68B6